MITKNIDRKWYMVIHTGQEFVHHKEKKINQHPLHLCGIPSGPFVTPFNSADTELNEETVKAVKSLLNRDVNFHTKGVSCLEMKHESNSTLK